MNHIFKIPVIPILTICSIICLTSCEKKPTLPTLTTLSVSAITQTTGSSGGNVTDGGGAKITARGVCWCENENPTTLNNNTIDGSGTGSFTSSLTSLAPGTTYYVRAYAINSAGTAYGIQVSFTTQAIQLPFLTTTAVASITQTTAVSGGNITDDGGGDVSARGVCWSTSESPTTADSKTDDGSGTGTFTSNLNGLNPGTTYYVRAYATNSAGTAYGNEVTFTTNAIQLPTVITSAVSSITPTTALSGGNVTDDGGGTVTARGVCWSITANPTTADNYTNDGSGIGDFTSNFTLLSPNTTYFIRAYATNSAGTAYGDEVSFTTEQLTDANGNVYSTVIIGTQLWMGQNLKSTKYNDGTDLPLVADNTEWANLTTPGYCWYNNDKNNYGDIYGSIYNWYAVNTGKLCPEGWHVPSDEEWTTLTDYLGGDDIAGGKLKEAGTVHWISPNTGATNESGFTALPGGYRGSVGNFVLIGTHGIWWCSSEYNTSAAWRRGMYYNSSNVARMGTDKDHGFSVRCLRD